MVKSLLISLAAIACQVTGSVGHELVQVKFVTAEIQGEEVRRLLEPMLQFVPAPVTCPSSQVHLTLGGSGPQSMTVSWVNPSLSSANTVAFGADTMMSSTATGKAITYTQLLAPSSGNLVGQGNTMGQPGATAQQINKLANTSSFAYDHTGSMRKWANYNNVKTYTKGQMAYKNPYAYYDSPMIHTTVLTGLKAGVTYFYKPAGACKTYNFTMTQAVGTYPFKAGLVADLGTTDVSAMSVSVLAAMKANVIIFTGDLSYGMSMYSI